MKITLGSIITPEGNELTIKEAKEYLANNVIVLPDQLALSIIQDKIKNCVGSTVKQIINK